MMVNMVDITVVHDGQWWLMMVNDNQPEHINH